MEILGVIVVMLIIACWRIPGLIHLKHYRELVAFLLLWFIAVIYAFLSILDILLISPIKIITDILNLIWNKFSV